MSHIPPDGPIARLARRVTRDAHRSKRQNQQQARLEKALKESRSALFLWAGGIMIVLAWVIYFLRFIPFSPPEWMPAMSIPVDEKPMAAWGQFGDFLGGILNPILSFLALLAVVKNLRLQAEQTAQAQGDRFASEVANRMSALNTASAVLTESINQDLDVSSKGGSINPERFQTKMNQRDELTRELLRLAQQLLDD